MDATGDKSQGDLNAVLADYFRRLDAGEMIDREAFLAMHPELADDLHAYFQQEEQLWRAARPAETVAAQHTPTPGRRLEVRCPHCHSPQELPVDAPLTDLTCTSCGSHFSLINPNKATWEAPSLSQMGRFELVERLGVGGFGSVWKARDRELDRTVAIKVPRRADMSHDETEKFFREARAAAQLRHPNIVSVHEVGREGDSVYIVSDFVRGVTLGDWLTGQQLTCREAAELCDKIARALHHAHEQGVVHRDLKPANIIMNAEGEPHLMDFGLARREVGEVTVTIDGQVLGTPAYMSPEQAQGEAHTADCRSDVYSLGVILFQLLTGELPFRGNARMLIHQVINDEPPSPRKLNSHVPRDLETITLKCLNKDPAKRYPTAHLLSTDLRCYLDGLPIAARPVPRATRILMWCKKNPLLGGSLAATLMSLLLGTIVAVAFAIHAERNAATARIAQFEAENATKRAEEQRVIAEREQISAQHRLAQSILAQGQADIERRRWPEAIASLDEACSLLSRLQEDTLPAELSLWQAQLHFSQPMYMLPHKVSERCLPVFSATGHHLNLLDLSAGTCKIHDAATGEFLSSYKLGPAITDVVLSHNDAYAWIRFRDGSTALLNTRSRDITSLTTDYAPEPVTVLAVSDDGALLLKSIDGNHLTLQHLGSDKSDWTIPDFERVTVACATFSRDGRYILLGTQGNSAHYVDAQEQRVLHTFRNLADWVFAVDFSPDGDHAVIGIGDNFSGGRRDVLSIYNLETKQVTHHLEGHTEGVAYAKFSDDGDFLVSGSHGGWLFIWDPQSGTLLDSLRLGNGMVNYVSLSRDQSLIVATSSFAESGVWYLPRDRHRQRLGTPQGYSTSAKFSPKDDLIVRTGDRHLYVHERTSHATLFKAGPFSVTPWKCVISPDNRFVAVGDTGGHVRLFDLQFATEITHLAGINEPVRDLDITADGARLLVGYQGGRAVLFDVAAGKPLREWRFHPSASWVQVVRFISPNECILIVASDVSGKKGSDCEHTVILYNITDANQQQLASFKADLVYAAILDEPNNYVITSHHFGDRLRHWRLRPWKLVDESLGAHGLPWDIASSNDGRYLATGGAGVTFWNREDLARLCWANTEHDVQSVSISANGRQLLLTPRGMKRCSLWDLTNVSQMTAYRKRAEAELHQVFEVETASVSVSELIPWYRYLGALELIQPRSKGALRQKSGAQAASTGSKTIRTAAGNAQNIRLLEHPTW